MLTYGKPMVLIWFIKPYVWCTVKHMVQERHTSQNIWCKRRTYGAGLKHVQKRNTWCKEGNNYGVGRVTEVCYCEWLDWVKLSYKRQMGPMAYHHKNGVLGSLIAISRLSTKNERHFKQPKGITLILVAWYTANNVLIIPQIVFCL